jgi:hypothetical protein
MIGWTVEVDMGLSRLSQYSQPKGRYVFHSTPKDNEQSILNEGIRHSAEGSSAPPQIVKTLEELEVASTVPFDPRSATYYHILISDVEELIDWESEYANEEAIFVVDVDQIDVPMYVSDMSVAGDLMDYQYGGSKILINGDSIEEVVTLYQERLTPVSSWKDIAATLDGSRKSPELIINGSVPPSAIVDSVCIDGNGIS